VWPTPGRATLQLSAPAAGQRQGARTTASAQSVWVQAQADDAGHYRGPTTVSVDVFGHDKATQAGVNGVVLTVEPRDIGTGNVRVGVDYRGFAEAFGGNYGQRLHLVRLPACALSTPQRAECRSQTRLPSSNDVRSRSVSATLPLTDGASAT